MSLPRPADRPFATTLLVTGTVLAWLVCAFAPFLKYLPFPMALTSLAVSVIGIGLAMVWLKLFNRSQKRAHFAWFLLLFLLFTAAFAALHPVALQHRPNSSDREDALRVSLLALKHHQYPYDFRTFLGNKPTPLPGALWLAKPFFSIGHLAWQNLFWLGLFFVFTFSYFRYRATALFFLSVFLLITPPNLADFTSGGDYLTNFFYVAIAVFLFIQALEGPLYACVLASLFLGLTLSSRALFGIVLVPLLAIALQRASASRTAIAFLTVVAAAAPVTLPVFMPHPLPRLAAQLAQNSSKYQFLPEQMHAHWAVPLLALAVACICFFVRMDLPRLFLAFGAASFVLLAPFVISYALQAAPLRTNFSYLSVSTFSFALWSLSRFEFLPVGPRKPTAVPPYPARPYPAPPR